MSLIYVYTVNFKSEGKTWHHTLAFKHGSTKKAREWANKYIKVRHFPTGCTYTITSTDTMLEPDMSGEVTD